MPPSRRITWRCPSLWLQEQAIAAWFLETIDDAAYGMDNPLEFGELFESSIVQIDVVGSIARVEATEL
jgi:hypothetical protein